LSPLGTSGRALRLIAACAGVHFRLVRSIAIGAIIHGTLKLVPKFLGLFADGIELFDDRGDFVGRQWHARIFWIRISTALTAIAGLAVI
jgi:hypothetical protein